MSSDSTSILANQLDSIEIDANILVQVHDIKDKMIDLDIMMKTKQDSNKYLTIQKSFKDLKESIMKLDISLANTLV